MAEKKHIFVDQGSTFEAVVDLVDTDGLPFNANGYSSRSQFRKHYASSNSYTITTSINANAATLTLSLAAADTANVAAGRYVYDAEIYIANTVYRVVEGILTISPEVTRS